MPASQARPATALLFLSLSLYSGTSVIPTWESEAIEKDIIIWRL